MRIEYSNLGRPKQAAKNLTRLSANLKLSRVHEILARVVGYRDWHDLTTSVRPDSPAQSGDIDVGDAWHLILTLADMLGLPYADVQHAISRARLLRDTPWSLDEQLAIRAKIWRHRIFGPPSRGKPGTIVRDNSQGKGIPRASPCVSYTTGQAYLFAVRHRNGQSGRFRGRYATQAPSGFRAVASLVALWLLDASRRFKGDFRP